MKVLSLATVAVAALTLPLAAQQPGGMPRDTAHGRPMQGAMMRGMDMDSMMRPMMRMMAYTPEHLLAEKEALHLTGDQVSRLTALGDAARTAHDAAARQAMMHMGEMEEVMHGAAPDTSAVKHHLDAAHRFMGDAMWAMLRSAAQARALLTDAQRSQVDDMAKRPMEMRHGGM
jgi:hypothetical protein